MKRTRTAIFSHLSRGKVRMVNVREKSETERIAVARAVVRMLPSTLRMIKAYRIGKGNVLTTAQIAGIHAAKRTAELIPLCHAVPLTFLGIEFQFSNKPVGVVVMATAMATAKTGVEMEALTAVSMAALTIYDMCKSVERGITITDVQLLHKAGGKSGTWNRGQNPESILPLPLRESPWSLRDQGSGSLGRLG